MQHLIPVFIPFGTISIVVAAAVAAAVVAAAVIA